MRLVQHLRNAWLIVGVTIVLFIGVEVGSYILLKLYLLARYGGSPVDSRSKADGYEDRAWAVQYFKEYASLPSFKWHSYVYWRRAPAQGRFTNIDDRGLRRTWRPDDSTGPRVHIFMMGGSAVWGTGAQDDETIPSIVAKVLTREHHLNVEVTNFGASAYVSTQGVITLLRELQRGSRPNLVIFYDGVNDVSSAYQNKGMAGLPNNEVNREREFNLLHPKHQRRLYTEVMIVTFANSYGYHALRSLVRHATGRDLLGIDFDSFISAPSDQVASNAARVYAENMKVVKSLGRAYGFRAQFYWQPRISTKNSLTPYEQRILREETQMAGYYAEATRAVNALLGGDDAFHDVSGVFRGDPKPYFIDNTHLTGAGNQVVARRIVKDIVPMLGPRG